jgi:tetratricopeptide (TPR) repeat protein
MGNVTEAITQLTGLLSFSPTDGEAWVELSDLYLSQGMVDQAIFCLEEVLLIQPHAWNVRRITVKASNTECRRCMPN